MTPLLIILYGTHRSQTGVVDHGQTWSLSNTGLLREPRLSALLRDEAGLLKCSYLAQRMILDHSVVLHSEMPRSMCTHRSVWRLGPE